MRDKRKSKEYFEKYLSYQYERVTLKSKKLQQCSADDIQKRNRICLSLLNYKMDLLIAEFSYGASAQKLSQLYCSCCDTACAIGKISYETSVRLLSIGILLDDEISLKALIHEYDGWFQSDKLLHCLSTFASAGKIVWKGNLLISEVYSPLNAVFESRSVEDAVTALKNYLAGWYDSCSSCAWHGTEDSKNQVYCGYWSFESAAIAKMLTISPESMKNCEYFPLI